MENNEQKVILEEKPDKNSGQHIVIGMFLLMMTLISLFYSSIDKTLSFKDHLSRDVSFFLILSLPPYFAGIVSYFVKKQFPVRACIVVHIVLTIALYHRIEPIMNYVYEVIGVN